MVDLFITIDTEYSVGLYQKQGPDSRSINFTQSIRCSTSTCENGVHFQLEQFRKYGVKAVFFVDPMPALIWGVECIRDIVHPILEAGQDVQLHMHTEWLEHSRDNNPLPGRTGNNIREFTLPEQTRLIGLASDFLVEAGAPRPVAFRAGNYGANDDTLRALFANGILYDTSHCPGIERSECSISLGRDCQRTLKHCGVIEVPISAIGVGNGQKRHFQLTALSASEILAALDHSHDIGNPHMTLVSHSFELMSRNRQRTNMIIKRRFEHLLKGLAQRSHVRTCTYRENLPAFNNDAIDFPLLTASPLRSLGRNVEQAIGNLLYGRR